MIVSLPKYIFLFVLLLGLSASIAPAEGAMRTEFWPGKAEAERLHAEAKRKHQARVAAAIAKGEPPPIDCGGEGVDNGGEGIGGGDGNPSTEEFPIPWVQRLYRDIRKARKDRWALSSLLYRRHQHRTK